MSRIRLGIAAATLTTIVTGAASADVVINLDNFTAAGFQFTNAYLAGDLVGTLTGVTVNATLVQAGVNFTWASDLATLVSTDDLSPPYYAQVGGFSQIAGVGEYTDGLDGFSSAAGTLVSYSYDLVTSLDMSDKAVWIGNGYASGGNGVWTGSITLHGVSAIPAPGALALLGAAGFIARRRRA